MKWIIAALGLLLLSLLLDLGMLAYAVYAVAGLILVGRWLTLTWIRSLQAERHCSQSTAEVGDRVDIQVEVHNGSRLPVAWVLMEDLLPRHVFIYNPPRLAVRGRRLRLTMLAPGGRRMLNYQLRCNRRGYYQIGPLVLETGDLFGLHRRYRVGSEPQYLLVYPQVVPLTGFEIASQRPIGEVRMTHRLYEDPTRIAGVRAYQPGDPLNRVHWKATARTGTLHSKLYEPSTVAGATLLLEFHQDQYDMRHEPYRSELAVTAAASVASALCEMGQQVGLVTNGRDAVDRIRQEGWQGDYRTRQTARRSVEMSQASTRLEPVQVRTRRGVDQLLRILETLARVELTDGLPLDALLEETTGRMPRDATVLAILPRVTLATAITLSSLRSQGFAVAAIVNVYDINDFAAASGPLLTYNIPAYHLRDEETISTVCRRILLR